jgi:hypothetical protein
MPGYVWMAVQNVATARFQTANLQVSKPDMLSLPTFTENRLFVYIFVCMQAETLR